MTTNYKFRIPKLSDLSIENTYGEIFEEIAKDSDIAKKDNKPFLFQSVFVTMDEGSNFINTNCGSMFEGIGDCDEKPEW